MISCNQYDYIEIVCLYRYPIKLTLKNNQTIEGIALDTARNQYKQECIKLNQQQGNLEGAIPTLVILDEISSMQVCIDNPHFTYIEFD
ncbi:Rho-binding antiterminator [Shewanella sp. 10N.261.52.F9]|uniref:Rho-binding antiterminator n=1 Tax=Shewanella TaxID=22 RepID=UPI00200C386C|nr:Rho-binding antiterminator [Shewanella marinintestina]MCL1147921.1 Rho-binding antiterminator [Shewanella marinintestina]